MIGMVRRGEKISIVDYQVLTETIPDAAYRINEAKKEFNRKRFKEYRNGTGKRTKVMDLTEAVFEEECDIQALAEEQGLIRHEESNYPN